MIVTPCHGSDKGLVNALTRSGVREALSLASSGDSSHVSSDQVGELAGGYVVVPAADFVVVGVEGVEWICR